MRLLLRAALRYHAAHRWQLALALLGVALGIAVVVAVDLSTSSARDAFLRASERVVGRATDRVVGPSGGLDERLYVRLRLALPELPAAPVLEGRVEVAGRALTLLGVDPFAEAPFRPRLREAVAQAGLAALLAEPGAVLLERGQAATLGIAPGARLTLLAGGRRVEAHLAGVFTAGDPLERGAAAGLMLADIATAQELLGRLGRIDRIDLALPAGGEGAALRERLAALLPPGASVVGAGEEVRFAARMTGAFELNLDMLGLLAVLIGAFLIYNTMAFSVVRRRELIGRLRALGVTRGQIAALLLAEAALLGAAGAGAGIALGTLLARTLVGLVVATVNDLYYSVAVSGAPLTGAAAAKALALGVGTALGAALVPVGEALRVAPRGAQLRSLLEARARRLAGRGWRAALLALGVAGAALALPGGGLGAGFTGMFALVAAAALAAPGVTLVLLRLLAVPAAVAGGVLGRLAVRGAAASLSRTAVAVAALMVALAATIGVAVMVDSFRLTVASWLESTLRADLYVGTPGEGHAGAIDEPLIERIVALPGVAEVSAGRSARVRSPQGPVEVLALRMASASYRGFELLAGDPAAAWRAFDRGAAMVSEPLAYRRGLAPGSRLELAGERGPVRLEVAGVYRDYGSERGKVLISRATWERYWAGRGFTALGVYLAAGVEAGRVADRIRALVPGDAPLRVRPSAAIREASLAVFDRTFAITGVLRGVATLVAFLGVLGALMALELERGREVAVLRAQGMTRAQLWGLVEGQSALLGLIAGLLAAPLGLLLGWLLIEVVNRRSFGWSMSIHVDPWILVQALALALLAALLAGLYPAWRMAGTAPALALREE